MTRRPHGFTLVELLIVIAILAALIGLTTAAVTAVQRKSQVKACKATIDAIAGALASYESDFGDYPPTSLAALGARTNRTNEGSEALVRCLTTKDRGGPYYDFKEQDLGNTDGDRLSGRGDRTSSALGSRELYEVLDPWGNPLIYFHHRDYKRPRGLDRYQTTGEEGLQTCRPRPSDKTGQYPGYGRFVIWSCGPDGVNEDGEGDDVCSWK